MQSRRRTQKAQRTTAAIKVTAVDVKDIKIQLLQEEVKDLQATVQQLLAEMDGAAMQQGGQIRGSAETEGPADARVMSELEYYKYRHAVRN